MIRFAVTQFFPGCVPSDPDDDWDHQTGYSPRFIVTHSDASIEWTAGDFD